MADSYGKFDFWHVNFPKQPLWVPPFHKCLGYKQPTTPLTKQQRRAAYSKTNSNEHISSPENKLPYRGKLNMRHKENKF